MSSRDPSFRRRGDVDTSPPHVELEADRFERYLREVCRIAQLSGRAEVELGLFIDAGHRRALSAILGCSAAKDELTVLARELRGKRIRVEEIVYVERSDAAPPDLPAVLDRAARCIEVEEDVLDRLLRPRLTREAFARIRARIEAARRSATSDERDELVKTLATLADGLAASDRAKAALVEANLPLVVDIAREHGRAREDELACLVREGNVGLLNAADRFDYTRGDRFTTYAAAWIRASMQKSLFESKARGRS